MACQLAFLSRGVWYVTDMRCPEGHAPCRLARWIAVATRDQARKDVRRMGTKYSAEGREARWPRALVSGGENTVLLDMRREAQCVLAVKAFGELCVARLERIDDLLVIFDRALGTMFLSQRHVADRPHMDEEISRHLGDQRAFAQLDDGLMEGDVRLGIFVHVLLGRL